MTLRASLLRQLENPALSHNGRAELRCQVARELEDAGEYEEAREAMGDLWRRVGERPRLEGLDRSTSAEVLLRAGVLSGWIGHAKQIEGAQEAAKNLISESRDLFASSFYTKRVLEAQTELAYCYWREGGYDEARIVLKETLAQLVTDSDLKAKAILRSAIVERSSTRYSDALRLLMDSSPLFEKITNHTVKGGYHNELGLVLKNLAASERREDYLDRAFVEYAAASFHFEQVGHRRYRANVENNLGFLYFEAKHFKKAHEHLERARELLASLKDGGTVAQVDETRARVYLVEGRNTAAERTARTAVAALEQGGRQSLLAEALTTHGAALARLGQDDKAQLSLYRAVEVAYQSGALNDAGLAALTLVEELGERLGAEELRNLYERADAWLAATQHPQTLQRLRQAAGRVLTAGREREGERAAGRESDGAFREAVKRYERELIQKALSKAGGSVTGAARILGITHQALAYLLEKRHRELLPARTPAKRRKRSAVKKRLR